MPGCSAELRNAWAIDALRRMWPNPTIPCEYIATRGGDGGWVGRLSRRGRPGRTRGGEVAALARNRMSSTTLSIWASSCGVASVPDRAPSTSCRLEPLRARCVAARPAVRCSSAGTTGSPHTARWAAAWTYLATRRAASGTPRNPGKLDMSTTYARPPLSTTLTPNRSMPRAVPQRRAMSTSSGESGKGTSCWPRSTPNSSDPIEYTVRSGPSGGWYRWAKTGSPMWPSAASSAAFVTTSVPCFLWRRYGLMMSGPRSSAGSN